MGCQQSRLINLTPTPLTIADSALLKPSGESVCALLQRHNLAPKAYMNVDCLLNALAHSYTNNVVVRAEDLQEFKEGLAKTQLDPRIFVLGSKKDGENYGARLTFFSKYDDLPGILQQHDKTEEKKAEGTKKVDVRILKDFRSEAESQLFIFEETLKAKGITYHFYDSFNQLEKSTITSPLLVVDYRFHRAVIGLGQQSKVICYCRLTSQEEYDSGVFFITNNFQEVVNEALTLKRLTQPVLPLSKLFIYSTGTALQRASPVFEHFGLRVRLYSSLTELIKATRLYFSVLVVCSDEQGEEVERRVREEGCGFRLRVLQVPVGTEWSAVGLRRVVREAKRGYLVERGPSKVVDIIDKYHNSAKFVEIKKELTANGIAFKSYPNIPTYFRSLTFIAPVIICSFDDRLLLHRFLGEAQSRAKVVVFCNRNKITEHLTRDPRWSFASSHFSKIIRHIRALRVLLPALPGSQTHNRPQPQKQHRVSAIKWAQQATQSIIDIDQQFLHLSQPAAIDELAKQYCSRLKLPSRPVDSLSAFRKDLLDSIGKLRSQYRLNILEGDFSAMRESFGAASLQELAVRARQFLGEEKDLGIGLNNTLKSLPKLRQEDYQASREAVFLLCLNFLGCYQLPLSQNCRLACWTQETCFDQCTPGSILLSKNFLVLREEGEVEELPGCVKLQLDLEYSPLLASSPQLSPYFVFEGRYVLAPHSQLQVTRIDASQGQRVVHLSLTGQNHFLQQYFRENLGEDVTQLFKAELAKGASQLLDTQHQTQIQSNLSRLRAFSLLHKGQGLAEAASLMRGLVHQEEQSENFDGRLLSELKLQLATILSKQSCEEEVVELISDIKEGSPSPFLRKMCSKLLAGVGEALAGRAESRASTRKCVELRAKMQQEEQGSSEEPLPDRTIQYQNLFQCLQLDERQGLAEQFS